MVEARYFVPIAGLVFAWNDDQEWHDVSNWQWLVAMLYNSVLLTAVIFGILWLVYG